MKFSDFNEFSSWEILGKIIAVIDDLPEDRKAVVYDLGIVLRKKAKLEVIAVAKQWADGLESHVDFM